MTRETKVGLVVSCSFMCLVGVVLYTKMKENAHRTVSSPYAQEGTTPVSPADPTPSAGSSPPSILPASLREAGSAVAEPSSRPAGSSDPAWPKPNDPGTTSGGFVMPRNDGFTMPPPRLDGEGTKSGQTTSAPGAFAVDTGSRTAPGQLVGTPPGTGTGTTAAPTPAAGSTWTFPSASGGTVGATPPSAPAGTEPPPVTGTTAPPPVRYPRR